MDTTKSITRRDTARLLLAGAAAVGLPRAALAASAEEWQNALLQALDAATVRGSGTTLSLFKFEFGRQGRRARIYTAVRMDWPPGWRMRPFDVTTDSERETFGRVVEAMVAEFRTVNPDGVRAVRIK